MMAESKNEMLQKSIIKLICSYYAAELAVFFIITLVYAIPIAFFFLFLAVQTIFLTGISMFLIAKRNFFYLVSTGEILHTVNLATKITLFRISMIPVVIFQTIALKSHSVGHALAFFLGLTCLSDLFDGYVSRRLKQVSYMGKILDSSCDYLLVGVVAITYYIYHLLPSWLFWLMISRLLIHSIGMLILYILSGKLVPQTTIFGKIATATGMIILVYKPAELVFPVLKLATVYVEIGAGVLIALSLADKGIFLIRGISRQLLEAQGASVK